MKLHMKLHLIILFSVCCFANSLHAARSFAEDDAKLKALLAAVDYTLAANPDICTGIANQAAIDFANTLAANPHIAPIIYSNDSDPEACARAIAASPDLTAQVKLVIKRTNPLFAFAVDNACTSFAAANPGASLNPAVAAFFALDHDILAKAIKNTHN